MSTVAEVKAAVENLSPQERQELFRWLSAREDFQQQRLEELRREIAVGVAQADTGDVAPLHTEALKREVRRRLAERKK